MAATLATAPPNRAYSLDPIWIAVETDLITGAAAWFEITIADGGPSIAETLILAWPGGSVTYTVAAAQDSTGLKWPTQGVLSLTSYTNAIASFLRKREDITDLFLVTVEDAPGGVIRLTKKLVEAFDISFTDGMTNVAVTATDGTVASAEDNLRALVQVWTYTNVFNDDRLIIALHGTYDIATAAAAIDISAAFAHLAPHLPDPDTILPASPPASLDYGEATSAFEEYALRLADKYGSPAVAEALNLEVSWIAVFGSLSAEAAGSGVTDLCHSYIRRDGAAFRKPVGRNQPDWIYLFPPDDAPYYVSLDVYWSDGTTEIYNPFGTTTVDLVAKNIYWFPAGYTQLKLDALTPSGGTDPDAYIVRYDWKLRLVPEDSDPIASFSVLTDSEWGNYLLFATGRGGCESVWMRGKSAESYQAAGEEFRRPRQPDFEAADGDFAAFATSGRRQIEMNSGWHPEDYYMEHLRQLPLGDAWLIDTANNRFLRIIIESKTLENIRENDQTLYNLKITARAGWLDVAASV